MGGFVAAAGGFVLAPVASFSVLASTLAVRDHMGFGS